MSALAGARRLSVLIVEDVEDDAALDAMFLEDAGYAVHWQRVQDANGMASALGERRWDLVLCDHAMPRFSAFAALRTLEDAHATDTPMIVVSGAIGEETAAAVIRDGAADFVNKRNLRRLPTVTAAVLLRARTRRAAAHMEAQFHSAFDDAPLPSAVVELRPRAGRIHRVNRALCAALGLSGSRLKHMHLAVLVDPRDRTMLQQDLASLAEGTADTHRAELRLHTATGELRWFLLSLSRVRDGSPRGGDCAIAQLVDMTARKETEETLERTREHELEASRLRSEFVANMSHEIRTPLNGILGLTDLLADTALTAEQGNYVGTLRASGKALLRIVEHVLDFSKIEAGNFQQTADVFEPAALVRRAMEVIAGSAEPKGLSVSTCVEADLPKRLRADSVHIGDVLVNLLGNAIKFTASGGEVSVHVSSAPEQPLTMRVEVSDTGIGIEPSLQDRVFEPFWQAEQSMTRRYGGTGLGLTISRQLVQRMHGRIGVTSTPGKGSTFWFEIPCQAVVDWSSDGGDPKRAARAQQPGRSPVAPGVPVLLADDDRVNVLVAQALLERAGCQVEIAANGSEAVERALTRDYDMVFMDCQMPLMDGYAATRAIREQEGQQRHTPIVAMTAHAMPGDREKCLAAGMDDYIAKPVKREELRRAVARFARAGDDHVGVAAHPSDPATPTAPQPPGPLPLSPEVLIDTVGEDAAGPLWEMFTDEAEQRLSEMNAAIEAQDVEAVHKLAHSLKGAAATVGAAGVAKCSDALCNSKASGGAATEQYARLREALDEVKEAITSYTMEATS